MSRILIALLLLVCVPAFAQDNVFADDTFYDARILSTAPLRVEYQLYGEGRYRPADFDSLRLSGHATLVYAYRGDDVQLHAPEVLIDGAQNYQWRFAATTAAVAASSIVSVQPVAGSTIALDFAAPSGQRPLLHSRFIVEFTPGTVYDPRHAHLQVVYLKAGPVAPHIDVFSNSDSAGH